MTPRLLLGLVLLALAVPASGLDTVMLQLKWTHAFQFAGYYAALELGYYRQAGLDVQILPARPGLNPVDEVMAGRTQYGVGSSSLLLARQAGKPVVVLAAVFQHSPLVLIARQKHPLQAIHDLAGMPVMLEPQSEELIAYLRRERVPLDQFQLRAHSYSIKDLVDGKVAAMSAYASNEPYELEQAHVPYQMYTPRSAGIDFYGDNLFTSERELADHPERVEAFRAASLRGWQYAMAHPGEIADLIRGRYDPGLTRDFLLFEASRMADLMRTDLIEVGYMVPGRWRHIADTYAELGLMQADFPLEGFLYRIPVDRALNQAQRRLILALVTLGLGVLITVYILRINRQLARTRDSLRQNESRYRMLTEQMKDVVWTLDTASLRFTYVSPSVARLRGYSAQEVMAAPMTNALEPASVANVTRTLREQLARFEAGEITPSDYITLELEQPCKNGTKVWTEVIAHFVRNQDNGHIEVHGASRDVSERRRQQARIEHMAQHDQLTGLANRALFDSHLEQALAEARRDRTRLALVYLDLDRFKPVNDDHGHGVGDRLLQAVAQRMLAGLRESDIVARIGGDEFVILLRGIENAEFAILAADKVRHALELPFQVDGHELTLSASLGIALYPDDGRDEVTLLHHADNALYAAKRAGRNIVKLHGQ
jgi:diguanylate cyclase (GGDEF)-like protein/PAS domain S-box-containing protein